MAMETRGVLASYDPATDMLTVWSATQTPHLTRRMLADQLGRNIEQIRYIAPDVGGGFGPKAICYAEETVIAAAAMRLGRPVKWIEDRREHFMCATQERDQYWDVEIAVDRDGRILGVRGTMLHDTGAFVPWGIIMPYIAAATMPGPYVLPAYRLDVRVALTNKVATTPVRGAGRPQAVFAMERLMDRVARKLGLDRAEVRRRNFIQPEQMPYSVGLTFRDGKPLVYDSGDYPKGQRRPWGSPTTTVSSHGRRRRWRRAATSASASATTSRGRGSGRSRASPCACCRTARSPSRPGRPTRARARARRSRRSSPMRSAAGSRTSCSRSATPTASPTASAHSPAGRPSTAGSSAMIAGKAVRGQIVAMAARALGVAEADIDVEDSRAMARTGNKPVLGFGELARMAQGMPGFSVAQGQQAGLESTAYFTPPQAAYCSGCHVAEVEVDIGNGRRHDPRLRRRARRRQPHQSADRRRPGAGRRRARHRQRAAGVDEVRRQRPAAVDQRSPNT